MPLNYLSYCSIVLLSLYSAYTIVYPFDSPGSSASTDSACNAGDPCSVPGLGRSSGEGISYPLQYSWASLVAQLVKNLPAIGRPGFSPWAGENPWRRKQLPTPVPSLAWRMSWTVQSIQRVWHDWATFTFTLLNYFQIIQFKYTPPVFWWYKVQMQLKS